MTKTTKNGNRKSYAKKGLTKAIKTEIKRMSEKKYLTNTQAGYTILAAGGGILLNASQQGTSAITRVGDRIKMTSVEVKGTIYGATPATDNAIMRMLIIVDKKSNGATTLLNASTAPVLDSASIYAPINESFKHKYHILHDRLYEFDPTTPNRNVVIRKNFSAPVTYNGNTGGITDIQEGAMYIMFIGNSGVGRFSGITRVKFEDL